MVLRVELRGGFFHQLPTDHYVEVPGHHLDARVGHRHPSGRRERVRGGVDPPGTL